MKKLLMLGAILVLGATAFAADQNVDGNPNEAESTVTVKAHLVAQNLVISDLEGKQIVLDFGKVSKTRSKGTSEAETGYMVRYVGNPALKEDKELTMKLKGDGDYAQTAVPVTMTAVTQEEDKAADKFKVLVGLNTYTGTMLKDASKPADSDYSVYKGTVFGTLHHDEGLASLASGDYLGHANLRVTIAE